MRLHRAIMLSAALLCLSGAAAAQTAATGAVVGTVTDPSGAVVPGAMVTLTNTGTNATRGVRANSQGGYAFPDVIPGVYTLTVTAKGFRVATITNVAVTVNKSSLANVKLTVGAASQTVEAIAGAAAQLQTVNATVGDTVGATALIRLPTLQHDASELLDLQPAASADNTNEVRVAGAVDDQNTITLDGIDISGNVIAGAGQNVTAIPIPVDSVQEFRVGVSNYGASMNRSSGGEITLVGRRGTNQFHGALYGYYQNNKLNANTWDDNHTPVRLANGTLLPSTPRPPLQDKRFGARVGGPIAKNQTFYFVDYEGRRFARVFDTATLVPTDTLKAGTLQFRNAAGTVEQYPLATAAFCGAGGNQACDPRGLGISPTVQAMNKLYPEPNDFSEGDGLNYAGFDSTVNAPLTDDYWVGRLDHNFSSKWQFDSSYTYSRELQDAAGGAGPSPQFSVVNGNVRALKATPDRGDMIAASLTGQLTPTVLNSFHWGWVRNRTLSSPLTPTQIANQEQLPGTQTGAGWIAYQPTSLFQAPIDDSTGNARYQKTTVRNIQYIDDLDWVVGSHTIQTGFTLYHLPTIHERSDKVVGSITSLAALADADVTSFLTIPAADRPPTCGSSVTTANCLQRGDVQNWDRLYASTLGLLDNVGILAVRNAQLQPEPFGTNLVGNATMNAYNFYGQDIWRLSPSLTATYGIAYGWQTPPTDANGLQTLLTDNATGQALTAQGYLQAKLAAAQAGQTPYNPTLAYLPIKNAGGRTIINTDWGNVAPRMGLAWNPSFDRGWLGSLFGHQKTVLRGGFAIVYDRSNMVQDVEIPMLGVGFADTVTVPTPACNLSGTPGTGCNASPASPNAALSDFRVGVDGTLPVPSFGAATSPVVPSTPFGELLSFQLDPNNKIGRAYTADFTVQRELPAGLLLEAGWIGHYGRDLPEAINFSNAPYMYKDTASGQTFAQAFDAVANALRAGGTAPDEPWFDDMLPGLTVAGAAVTGTAYMAQNFASSFINGNVSTLFNAMDGLRAKKGLPAFDNRQVLVLFMRTHLGRSNYNGLVLTLRKQAANGLSFDVNYTWSHSLDNGVSNQDSAGFFPNSFYPDLNYGASGFDRRQVLNATTVWNLPFGRGRFSTGNWIDHVIDDWYASGIFTAETGFPVEVSQGSQVYGGGAILSGTTYAIPTVAVSSLNAGLHSGVASSTTGLNLFSNPATAFGDFRPVELSSDGLTGRSNPLTGLPFVNLDMSFGKKTQLTEKLGLSYSVDFFNMFNNVNFNTPSLSITRASNFGNITSQFVPANRTAGSRWIELGVRLDF